jgi:HEPN domain-containing protein
LVPKAEKTEEQRQLITWYTTRTFLQKREAERYFSTGRYAESVICSLDCIEYAVKSMCKITNVKYNPTHGISKLAVVQLAEKVRHSWRLEKREAILQALPTIVSYTDEQRSAFRYGVEDNGIPPITPVRIVGRGFPENALRDARRICQIMHELHVRMKWGLT